MRVLLQRVLRARVEVVGAITGEIGPGYLALVGVTHTDTADDAEFLAAKVINLRVFDDSDGNLNRSAADLLSDGEPVGMLVVSQFTLYADCRNGRRPSFVRAAAGDNAAPLVDEFIAALRAAGFPTATGVFGAEMRVELVNNGPVTILLDTAELRERGS